MASIKIRKKHKKKTHPAIKPKPDIKEPSIVLQKKQDPNRETESKIQRYHSDTGVYKRSWKGNMQKDTSQETTPHKRKFKIVKGKRVYKPKPSY